MLAFARAIFSLRRSLGYDIAGARQWVRWQWDEFLIVQIRQLHAAGTPVRLGLRDVRPLTMKQNSTR
jgi:hypothetical protein